MNRIPAIRALADNLHSAITRVESALPSHALDGDGSWEAWNAADAMNHCAWWLGRDLQLLDNPGETIPIIDSGELERMNREIYELHRGQAWADARNLLLGTAGELAARIESMTEDQVTRILTYSDGRQRPLWWGLSGHLGLHVAWHLGIVLRLHGQGELLVSISEDTVSRSKALSDDPRWLAANHYDLAVAYAWAQRPLDAVGELKESFRLVPENRDSALEDDDLESLRDREDFQALCTG